MVMVFWKVAPKEKKNDDPDHATDGHGHLIVLQYHRGQNYYKEPLYKHNFERQLIL